MLEFLSQNEGFYWKKNLMKFVHHWNILLINLSCFTGSKHFKNDLEALKGGKWTANVSHELSRVLFLTLDKANWLGTVVIHCLFLSSDGSKHTVTKSYQFC